MARSHRHTPIFGCASLASEKEDLRAANRTFRRKAKQAVHCGDYESYRRLREISDVWDFAKDGRGWIKPEVYGDIDPDTGRSAWFEKLMRK